MPRDHHTIVLPQSCEACTCIRLECRIGKLPHVQPQTPRARCRLFTCLTILLCVNNSIPWPRYRLSDASKRDSSRLQCLISFTSATPFTQVLVFSNMLLLGLTGSIATGKSTVSNILSAPPYNLPIIDADKVARQVVEPGTAGYKKIVEHFLPSTPDLLLEPTPANGGETGPQGKGRPLNRPALGRRVFAQGSEADKKALNKIVHPAVRAEMYKQMLYAYLRGSWCVVLDVPLLFESGWEPLCGVIMVVAVKDREVQKTRLRARDAHLTEEDADNRIAAQFDVGEKARMCLRRGPKAGVVLWNDTTQESLRAQIAVAMQDIKSNSPQWWATLSLLCPPFALMSGIWSFLRSWSIKRQLSLEQSQAKAKL